MNPIGFAKEYSAQQSAAQAADTAAQAAQAAVPSIVRVRFPNFPHELDYFNDQFDLKRGDLVFVDGKLAGQRGRVVAVSTHFKIRAEDYKRVVSRADTRVSGEFRSALSHLVTFDPATLPYAQVRSWVLPRADEDTEYFVSFDEKGIDLNGSMRTWPFDPAIAKRGTDYYRENRVLYLCLDGTQGKAIVDGTRPYEVEFQYDGGIITHLSCNCPCGYHCKHEVATLLQLEETLDIIEAQYAGEWCSSGYFSAVLGSLLFSLSVDGSSDTVLHLSQSEP